jgi:hypothetical protein
MLTSTFIHEKHKLSMKVGIQFTNAAIILTELLKWSKNVLDTQSIKILGKNKFSDSRTNFTDYQFVIKVS